jgi:hypothetical protein
VHVVVDAVLDFAGRLIGVGFGHVAHEIALQSVPVFFHFHQRLDYSAVAHALIIRLVVRHLQGKASMLTSAVCAPSSRLVGRKLAYNACRLGNLPSLKLQDTFQRHQRSYDSRAMPLQHGMQLMTRLLMCFSRIAHAARPIILPRPSICLCFGWHADMIDAYTSVSQTSLDLDVMDIAFAKPQTPTSHPALFTAGSMRTISTSSFSLLMESYSGRQCPNHF